MPRSPFDPCIPTKAAKVPDRPEWIHEIKHDGYRLIVQRDGKRVRLWTRNGHDWSGRFPLITEAALRNRNTSFVIDGEAVLLGVDGRSDFNGLHSRKHDHEVEFYAFDILVSDGEDLRRLPLSMRKANLARLLARRVDGIFLSDFEQGEIGPDLFRHACLMGLEGLVSKRRCPAGCAAWPPVRWRGLGRWGSIALPMVRCRAFLRPLMPACCLPRRREGVRARRGDGAMT
jgi:bifunctional non-homologous end joining protein LigD